MLNVDTDTDSLSISKLNIARSINVFIDIKEDSSKPNEIRSTSGASLIKTESEPKLKSSKSNKSIKSECISAQLQEEGFSSERKSSTDSEKSDIDLVKKRKGFFSSIASSLHKSKSSLNEPDHKSERKQSREHQPIYTFEKERKKSISNSSIRNSLTKTNTVPEIFIKEEPAYDISLQQSGINQSLNSVISNKNKPAAIEPPAKKNEHVESREVGSVQSSQDNTFNKKSAPKLLNEEDKVEEKKIETIVPLEEKKYKPQVAPIIETVPKKSRFLNAMDMQAMDMQAMEAIASQNVQMNKTSLVAFLQTLSETETNVKTEEIIDHKGLSLPVAPNSQPLVSKIDPEILVCYCIYFS